jgi:hypothetical protein
MSYTDADLKNEISAQINSALNSGDIFISDWVALAVIKKHLPDFDKNSDFVTNAVWGHVRKMVGASARNFKVGEDDSDDTQSVLPGFERLQQFYEVTRQEGATLRVQRIHRMKMTTAERRAEAAMLRKVGMANIEHGDQLDRETDELIAAGLIDPDVD